MPAKRSKKVRDQIQELQNIYDIRTENALRSREEIPQIWMLKKGCLMDADLLIPEDARIRYIERRQKDLDSLHAALKAHNFEEFKRIGHQLKGNASSFGYSDLEKIAIQLEVAGEASDLNEAARQLDLFDLWYSKTSVGKPTA